MKKRKGYVISVRISEDLGERFDKAIETAEKEIIRNVSFWPENIPAEIVIGKTQLITKWIQEWCNEMETKYDRR